MSLTPDELNFLTALAANRAAEGILCIEGAGAILYANDAAAHTLSQTASALTGRTIFQVAPEMNPALWQELWKEIRSHASFAFEFALAAAEEKLVPVEVTVHYLKPSQRELACFFFHDIEERKRLQTLQQEFVSTASHELRTPMTVIREGVSQVLEGLRGDINESQKRSLSIALNGIDRLGRIIDDLLDISKIESGRVTLRRERIDLAELAREVAAAFQSAGNDRGLDLRITTPAGPVMVYADRDRIVQVLTNLVNNAFKFTERGHIQISVTARKGEAECAVIDTGIGLAPGDAEKIFNKFEQLGQVAVTGEKGTGLGLSICRGILGLHKGRIAAESAGPGKGTRVSFILPRQAGQDVFKEHLTPLLHSVARRGGSLSTFVFRIDALNEAAGQPPTPSVVSALEAFIRKESGRRNDVLIKDVDTLYLSMESTVKREAERFAAHVLDVFRKTLARDGLRDQFRITCAITSLPDDTAEENAYLNKVFSQEAL